MKLTSKRIAAIAVGVVAAATTITLNAAPAAALTVKGCKSTQTFSTSITGASAEGYVKRGCTVKGSGWQRIDQDYIWFRTRDTKCDKYGPKIWIGGWVQKNDNGCGSSKTGLNYTASTGTVYKYMLRTCNSGGCQNSSGYITIK
ncbi:hypothetical protein AB0H88_26380 [Nonomuraea sp. NPDC050680]|uniref:hypothetical protein n=1 Tax=Nonomuraea sp. NPDC050680 TaxID=3154630 RepID=UPI0033FE0E86